MLGCCRLRGWGGSAAPTLGHRFQVPCGCWRVPRGFGRCGAPTSEALCSDYIILLKNTKSIVKTHHKTALEVRGLCRAPEGLDAASI